MPFTKKELEDMARFDAEIENAYSLTSDERRVSKLLDDEAMLAGLTRSEAEKIEHRKAWQREYYAKNSQKIKDYQKIYQQVQDHINKMVTILQGVEEVEVAEKLKKALRAVLEESLSQFR